MSPVYTALQSVHFSFHPYIDYIFVIFVLREKLFVPSWHRDHEAELPEEPPLLRPQSLLQDGDALNVGVESAFLVNYHVLCITDDVQAPVFIFRVLD